MKKWLKICFSTLLIISMLTFIAACSKDETKTVRIAEVTRSIFYAPQYVAIEKGFFEEEGVNVELTTTWGGDKTMTALLSNGADVALVGSETSIYVEAQGSDDPVLNFAQLTQTDGTFLVSREKIDDFSWDLLKGSDFLGQRKGGMPQMVGEFVLKKHNINPHQDLNLIQNVDFANIANAFLGGTGDFVTLFEPNALQIEKQGLGYVVASIGELGGVVPYTSYSARISYIEENPDVIEKFTRAIQKGLDFVHNSSNEKVAEAIVDFFPDTSLNDLIGVIERYRSVEAWPTTTTFSSESFYHLQEIMQAANELEDTVRYEDLIYIKD